jgi:aminopeptidase N
MSTYLVALIVSDFKCIKATAHPVISKNVEINVCARPNAVDQIFYALNVSTKLIEFFEEYYNVEYPLPKSGKNLNIFYVCIFNNFTIYNILIKIMLLFLILQLEVSKF